MTQPSRYISKYQKWEKRFDLILSRPPVPTGLKSSWCRWMIVIYLQNSHNRPPRSFPTHDSLYRSPPGSNIHCDSERIVMPINSRCLPVKFRLIVERNSKIFWRRSEQPAGASYFDSSPLIFSFSMPTSRSVRCGKKNNPCFGNSAQSPSLFHYTDLDLFDRLCSFMKARLWD